MSQNTDGISGIGLALTGLDFTETQGTETLRPAYDLPRELQHARPSAGRIIGRILLGILTAGISEGIHAIVKHARAGGITKDAARFSGTVSADDAGAALARMTPRRAFRVLSAMDPRKAAGVTSALIKNIGTLPMERQAGIIRHCRPGTSALLLQSMDSGTAAQILAQQNNPAHVQDIFSHMAASHAEKAREIFQNMPEADANKLLGSMDPELARILQTGVNDLNKAGSWQPKVKDQKGLIEYLRGACSGDPQGKVVESEVTRDVAGNERRLYEYRGIAFRGDNRSPEEIRKANGFHSRNDLGKPENLCEAQGLGKKSRGGELGGFGATGHSGVSMADSIPGAINYLSEKSGRIYIIDTTHPEAGKVYHMSSIVNGNKLMEHDGTGGEVNGTGCSMKAVIGWIQLTDAALRDPTYDRMESLSFILDDMSDHVVFNPDYGRP